ITLLFRQAAVSVFSNIECYALYLYLHSFPTRRSSDLHRALVFSQFTSYLRAVAAELDAQGIAYEYLDGSTRDRTKVIESFRTGRDRKSTRLNSSHVSISYAVFCVKKKE